MMHIRDCLPDIKSKISGMLAEVQMNIDALGESVDAQVISYPSSSHMIMIELMAL